MQQDGKTMLATALAHGGTPAVVDLKTTTPGKGRRLRIQFNGHSLAGATGVIVKDGSTSSPTTTLVTVAASSAELNSGMTIYIPETVSRYITIALVGTTSAGTYTAGVVLDDGHTNV